MRQSNRDGDNNYQQRRTHTHPHRKRAPSINWIAESLLSTITLLCSLFNSRVPSRSSSILLSSYQRTLPFVIARATIVVVMWLWLPLLLKRPYLLFAQWFSRRLMVKTATRNGIFVVMGLQADTEQWFVWCIEANHSIQKAPHRIGRVRPHQSGCKTHISSA